ncbi:hypothetical protein DYBT9275_02764 [Dyadobacter sp. CECT 9275]|uniref:Uncharacterized protein n=1 Tax=Dyadobacter helix TaxID=2822344 RepID=A0A916N662_9BACT|nr:hypothetical protein DYBT9275_02764 [Dyadobacter sp. CECT 9275]
MQSLPEDDEPTPAEKQTTEAFEALPEEQKVQFFVTYAMMLLDRDQIKNVIRILQQRIG